MPAPLSPQDRAAARLARAERREAAVKLAVAGHTYAEIVEASKAWPVGYNSPQAAHKDVKAALQERLKRQDAAADEYIALQLARLEEAHRTAAAIIAEYRELTPQDIAEDKAPPADQRLAAVDRVVKVSESVRKLLGLDAPTKVDTKVEQTVAYQIAVAPEELEQL